jgi:pyridoxamine 5'-phosphate oxidase
MQDITQLRRNYSLESLTKNDVAAHPIDQFAHWFIEALNSQLLEANASFLATASPDGRPSVRTVLLKGYDHQGFVFYTNYESRKGREIDLNPQAALLFNWLELERQVRIEGTIEKVSEVESRAYFQSRPRGSQIGAWASPQSRVISDRDVLEQRVQEIERQYEGLDTLPLPPHWGGYRIQPDWMEFWQGRESRLHDRIVYQKTEHGWTIERLAP